MAACNIVTFNMHLPNFFKENISPKYISLRGPRKFKKSPIFDILQYKDYLGDIYVTNRCFYCYIVTGSKNQCVK